MRADSWRIGIRWFWVPFVLSAPTQGAEIPAELQLALQNRDVSRAHINYFLEMNLGERRVIRVGDWRCAGDSMAEDLRNQVGDSEASRNRTLHRAGEFWHNAGIAKMGTMFERTQAPTMDIRRAGLRGVDPLDAETVRFEKLQVEGLICVTQVLPESESQPRTVKYWVDPNQDCSLVRVECFAGDTLALRTEIENAKVDGRWFPLQIMEFGPRSERPVCVLRIDSAKLGATDLPEQLGPADIGFEVGTEVLRETKEGRSAVRGEFWNGAGFSSAEELRERIENGELQLGPSVESERHRASAGEDVGAAVSAEARATIAAAVSGVAANAKQRIAALDWSEWEKYVIAFIKRHQLDREQAQRAWAIHADCVSQARRRAFSMREQIAEFERRVLSPAPSSSPSQGDDRLRALESQLRAPFDAIFESQLRPRLEKLLTRIQQSDKR